MRLPINTIPKYADVETENPKWPTVDFEHDMAKAIAKGKKKKKKKGKAY